MTMEDFCQKIVKCSHFAEEPLFEDKIEPLATMVKNLENQEEIQGLIDLLY